MKINRNEYLDKVRGCFIGKNIGGTFGGPYEGKKEVLDIKGFVTKKGEPLPNDDLDLQLVWLQCLESIGPLNTNSKTLGEFWMAFICPFWNEYGISKTYMLRGIKPSVAGDVETNIWKHSNGAWIRTEIWACLNPGAVDTAVRYAIEDALVDHGVGEGTAAAAFVAALESAAFLVNDTQKLIDIGLAKIDKNSRLHSTLAHVRKRYQEGADYITVRNEIIELNKDIGDGWFQAPNNIAFVVIGLLWGEGDFKKSMTYAVNCGDDTDCTAATVGSILGILLGAKKMPEDWKEYVGNDIKTLCINNGKAFHQVKTIDDLVDRINRQVDLCLLANTTKIELVDSSTEIDKKMIDKFTDEFGYLDEGDEIRSLLYSLKPNTFKEKVGPVTAVVTYENGIFASLNETKTLKVMIVNNYKAYGNSGHEILLELLVPSEFECNDAFKEVYAPCWTPMTWKGNSEEVTFNLNVKKITGHDATAILKVKVNDFGTEYFVPIKFLYK